MAVAAAVTVAELAAEAAAEAVAETVAGKKRLLFEKMWKCPFFLTFVDYE